jgi:hypothetical protein
MPIAYGLVETFVEPQIESESRVGIGKRPSRTIGRILPSQWSARRHDFEPHASFAVSNSKERRPAHSELSVQSALDDQAIGLPQ